MAPEVFDSPYGKPVDMWAVGIITYIMLTGVFPFHHDDQNTLIRRICNDPVVWNPKFRVSNAAKEFVESLLQKDPSKRLTVAQALKHPFIVA